MTPSEHDHPAPSANRLGFDRYVLDMERGCLFLGESEIVLRPKTFAVLRVLVENSGRLVSKEDLFAAVWPNIAVTDDVLVQSIGELRRALADDGQRLIKTIPRRGYRFEPIVSVVSSSGPGDASMSEMLSGQKAPTTLSGVGWRRALSLGFGLAALISATVFLNDRFGQDLKPDNQSLKAAETGGKPSIAILPLLNQNAGASRDYFADGLTQDIIHALGRFRGLTVMSWNAVFPYKTRPESPGAIARKLGVRYQVEGNVRQNGNRVQANTQLVDANGQVLWSARFDEALSDVFALQDAIATRIAGTTASRVAQVELSRISTKPTGSLEAYDYVLRARPALQHPDRGNIVQARELLRRAIETDPDYAAAYSSLAETFFIATSMGWAETPAEFLARAEEVANKALSLDDADVRARVVLGRIHIFYQRYDQARTEMDRAIEINPSDAGAIAGRGNILLWSGQTDAAIAALEFAQRIDPELNPSDRFALSLAYYLKGRYGPAIEQGERNLSKTSAANFSRVVLAAAHGELGHSEDAGRIVTMIRRLDPTFDAKEFGTKFLRADDLDHLRDGMRKAGLVVEQTAPR
ncbi:winged helix-turn-helix domain-containing protein [Bradyrhizobium lablabi]|uniref:winged helix-turn-helix domain-containing protein n=1 Tax=Bradyrhizobium lablabi TaxID=722472 RepID=UPI001BA49E69|nr:winged helix-turn-helix domain-containing protein [Bradyrhizobium lablabi]MBR0697565.1 winged helix-turn-helix domain-containing protein [Bradyrhizobium lablabi]